MFSFFSNKLTNASNNLIDWSRVGELLQSGTHRYTKDELIVRGSIIASTAISAFLGYEFNDEEKTNHSSLTVSMAAALAGFTISHAVVIYPLIKKRNQMCQECQQLAKGIEAIAVDNIEIPSNKIKAVTDYILELSMAKGSRSNASQTWGRRKTLLTNLKEGLANQNADLISALNNMDAKDFVESMPAGFSSRPQLNK